MFPFLNALSTLIGKPCLELMILSNSELARSGGLFLSVQGSGDMFLFLNNLSKLIGKSYVELLIYFDVNRDGAYQ